MLTRRTFFASLAALAVSPRVAPAVTSGAVALPAGQSVVFTFANGRVFTDKVYPVLDVGKVEVFDSCRLNWRDDGDTILELR
jgi:hypothetical protein